MTDAPVLLDASIDPEPELFDHPLELTPAEVDAGLAAWQAVDDLDDTDAGLPALVGFTSSGRTRAIERAQTVRDFLLAYGVPEVSIEVIDGRPTFGEDTWNALRPVSVFSHHIASQPTPDNPTPGLSLVKVGRSDLPGPLCNGTAGVDLVYRIVSLGWANHPGTGGPLTLSGPCGSYTIPKDVARPYAWGTEFEGGFSDAVWDRVYTNKRTGKSMTFREFMGRCNAALTHAIWAINGKGQNPEPGVDLSAYHGEHKTWAPGRKPDRLNYTTASGRAEAARYTTPEDDMPTPADLWNHPLNPVGEATEMPAKTMLAQSHNRAGQAVKQAQRNRDAIKAIGDRLDALAPGIAKAVTAALGDSIDVDVNVHVPGDNPTP